jgi:GT2 family glycosyltransferase
LGKKVGMYCSVIIPARNAAKTIGECVLAALSQSAPRELYEVIVVDDGSTDATGAIARAHGARVIPQPPLGIATAKNTGARAARGEILLFLEPDCVPALDWIAQMIVPFNEPSVAGVKGTYVTHETGLLSRLIQAEYEDRYEREEKDRSIDFVDGYSVGYRRSVFLKLGGFDPSLGAVEDLDLSYRLAKNSHRLVFAPKAKVYYNHGSTIRHYVAQKLRHGLWRSLVYARHPDKVRGDNKAASELRAQIPLAGLTLASVVLGSRWQRLLPLAGVFVAAFASTTVPFAWRTRRAGTDAALASPGLLFVRALALGAGLTIGGVSLVGQTLIQKVARLGRAFRY